MLAARPTAAMSFDCTTTSATLAGGHRSRLAEGNDRISTRATRLDDLNYAPLIVALQHDDRTLPPPAAKELAIRRSIDANHLSRRLLTSHRTPLRYSIRSY